VFRKVLLFIYWVLLSVEKYRMALDMRASPVILQVSTADIGGGTEKIAWDLHQGYLSYGYHSRLAVGRKRSNDPPDG